MPTVLVHDLPPSAPVHTVLKTPGAADRVYHDTVGADGELRLDLVPNSQLQSAGSHYDIVVNPGTDDEDVVASIEVPAVIGAQFDASDLSVGGDVDLDEVNQSTVDTGVPDDAPNIAAGEGPSDPTDFPENAGTVDPGVDSSIDEDASNAGTEEGRPGNNEENVEADQSQEDGQTGDATQPKLP